MKKLALALVVALGLSGCAQLSQVMQTGSLITQSYSNPVTRQHLYEAENAMIVAISGLQVYKKTCAQGVITGNCRATVGKIQVYTRKLPPLLTQVRAFVRNNDQVNAIVVFNEFVAVFQAMRQEAIANGVGGV